MGKLYEIEPGETFDMVNAFVSDYTKWAMEGPDRAMDTCELELTMTKVFQKSKLCDTDLMVVLARCGAFGERMTLQKIGDSLGVTRTQIMRREQRALRKLRWPALSKYLRPFVGRDE